MVSPLAGLDARDVVSERHPYLHLAGLEEPEAVGADAHLRRLRTARYTPGGLPQPPEVMGVDADARVPNWLQPMSGEFRGDGTGEDGGGEVSEGRPGFWGALMAPPTGVADGVGVGTSVGVGVAPRPSLIQMAAATRAREGAPVGAPTGFTRQQTDVAALPPQRAGAPGAPWMAALRAEPAALAGLPHFALGGVLEAGGTGIVGEEGEEAIHALPGGGVQVRPLAPQTASPAAAMTPVFDKARALSGAGAQRNFGGGLGAPAAGAGAYHVPAWRRALQLGLDVLAPRIGRAAEPWVEPGEARYERDLDAYQQQGKADLAALPDFYRAAQLESGDNKSAVGQWEAATRQADARRRADDEATYQRGLAQARERESAAEQRAAAGANRGDLRTITGSDGAYYSFDPRSGAVMPLMVGGRPLRAPEREVGAPKLAATKPPTRTQAAESYLSGLGDKLAGMDRGQVQRWLDRNPATMRRHGLTAADIAALAAQYGNGAAGQLDLGPAQ